MDAIFLLSFLPDEASGKNLGFSANKLLKLSHIFFFSVKPFTQLLKNFFEICRSNSNIMRFVNSLFLVFQNDTSTFTKAKSCSYSNK